MNDGDVKPEFGSEFFISDGYDSVAAANQILEGFKDHQVDLGMFREYLEKKVADLTSFVLSKSDELEIQCQAEFFLEEMKGKIADAEKNAMLITNNCPKLCGEGPRRKASQRAFIELNELLVERAKEIGGREWLENEQMWTKLKSSVRESIEEGDFKRASSLVSMAKEHLARISSEESFGEKKQIMEDVGATLCEALEGNEQMKRYENDIEKLRDLCELSIVIDKGSMFFALYLSPLRMRLEKWWRGYSVQRRTSAISTSEPRGIAGGGKRDADAAGRREDISYVEWLDEFFERSLAEISGGLAQIERLSVNHEMIAMSEILNIFCTLTPSFNRRFNIFIYSTQSNGSCDVEKLYDVCVRFSLSLEKLVAKVLDKVKLTADFFASRKFFNYSESLFMCFLEYQSEFAYNENKSLARFVHEQMAALDKRGRSPSPGQPFEHSKFVSDIFNRVHVSVSRCISITQGLALHELMPSIDASVERAFMNIFHAILNTHRVGSPERTASGAAKEAAAPLKTHIDKKKSAIQARAQFFDTMENLNYCAEFCRHLNKLSERLTESRIVNPKYPPPSFQVAAHDPELSTAASYILYTQSNLVEKGLSLREHISANVQLWIESLGTNHACSEESRFFLESASKAMHSVIVSEQKSLLENLIKPVEDNFADIIREPGDCAPDLAAQDEDADALPTHGATQIGEYLLTLPLCLDPYLSSEALNFSLDTLPVREGIMREYEPLARPSKSISSFCEIKYEDHTLACWIRAVMSITIQKFEQAMGGMAAPADWNARLQLKTDLVYLDNVVLSLDVKLPQLFSKAAGHARRKSRSSTTQ